MDGDVFEILRKNDADLSGHVGLILKTVGYSSLRAFAMIDEKKIDSIQDCVKNVLASVSALAVKSDKEKVDMFGPIFCNDPSAFIFLAGERDTILAAAAAATKMLLQYEVDDSRRKKKRVRQQQQTARKSKRKQPSSNSESKTLQVYVDNWFKKKMDVLDVISSDYIVDESRSLLLCKKCNKSFSIRQDSGSIAPRVFFKHLLDKHSKSNLQPSSEETLDSAITEDVESANNMIGSNDSNSPNKRPHSIAQASSLSSSSSSDEEDLEPVPKLPKNC